MDGWYQHNNNLEYWYALCTRCRQKIGMQIQHRMSGTHGHFYIKGDDDDTIAKLVYSITENGRMILEHTEVDEALRGQNIGYQLVQASVEHARKYDMKIMPVCPFAKAVFDKKPDFADVLA